MHKQSATVQDICQFLQRLWKSSLLQNCSAAEFTVWLNTDNSTNWYTDHQVQKMTDRCVVGSYLPTTDTEPPDTCQSGNYQ